MDTTVLSQQEAEDFFAEVYGGAHHILSPIKPFGNGWFVVHKHGSLDSFDTDTLTRLVFVAHSRCCRVSVMPHSTSLMKIAIWKRQREGNRSMRHPTINQALENYQENQ